jgi:hypothetical protein
MHHPKADEIDEIEEHLPSVIVSLHILKYTGESK